MSKRKDKKPVETDSKGQVTRRQFIAGTGVVVGGALLTACGAETITQTATKTTTATQTTTATTTATSTVSGPTVTSVKTETVSKYVCPSCGEEFSTLALLQEHFTAEHGAATAAALNLVSFTVNGQQYELQVDPNWDLQYVLHEILGLIDVKTFCYRGACGSCTVILNGRPILSCMKLAIHCDGAVIETASGIADSVPELADAYVKNHTMQCGYCTPGFLTTVKALLDRNDSPTAEDVVEAIAGNMCRCGTYPAHVRATLEAAEALKGGA